MGWWPVLLGVWVEEQVLLPSPRAPWEREAGAARGSSHGAADTFSFLPWQLQRDPSSRHPTGGTGLFSFPTAPHPETTPSQRSLGMPTPRKHPFPKVPKGCPAARGRRGPRASLLAPQPPGALTRQAAVHQLQVLVHGGEDLVAGAVDQYAGRQVPLIGLSRKRWSWMTGSTAMPPQRWGVPL